jgi:hypothetical protein
MSRKSNSTIIRFFGVAMAFLLMAFVFLAFISSNFLSARLSDSDFADKNGKQANNSVDTNRNLLSGGLTAGLANRIERLLADRKENGNAVTDEDTRSAVRKLIEADMCAEQDVQQSEVRNLRKRLAVLEQQIESRKQQSEAIIDEMLNATIAKYAETSNDTDH